MCWNQFLFSLCQERETFIFTISFICLTGINQLFTWLVTIPLSCLTSSFQSLRIKQKIQILPLHNRFFCLSKNFEKNFNLLLKMLLFIVNSDSKHNLSDGAGEGQQRSCDLAVRECFIIVTCTTPFIVTHPSTKISVSTEILTQEVLLHLWSPPSQVRLTLKHFEIILSI